MTNFEKFRGLEILKKGSKIPKQQKFLTVKVFSTKVDQLVDDLCQK